MSQLNDDWEQIETIFDILVNAKTTIYRESRPGTVKVIFNTHEWDYIQRCLDNEHWGGEPHRLF
jgi:hypothetical protein